VSRILAFVRKDARREIALLTTFASILILQVAGFVLGDRAPDGAEVIFVVLGGGGWIVQFLLVVRFIQGDAPSRGEAQWRSRPFDPRVLVESKVAVILLFVFLPPLIANQVLRLTLLFRPGFGDLSELLIQLAVLCAFCHVALVTPSLARAFLTLVATGIGFWFVVYLTIVLVWQGGPAGTAHTSPISTTAMFGGWLATSCAIAIANAYRKGRFVRLTYGVALLGSAAIMVDSLTHQVPSEEPPHPTATEEFAVKIRWETEPRGGGVPTWVGTIAHRTDVKAHVVTTARMAARHGWPPSEQWERADDLPVTIDGLGDVELLGARAYEYGTELRGVTDADFDSGVFRGNETSQSTLAYDVQVYRLLSRTSAKTDVRLNGAGWRLTSRLARSSSESWRIRMKSTNTNVEVGLLERETKRLRLLQKTSFGAEQALWPVGSGIELVSFYDVSGTEGAAGADLVVLERTPLATGRVSVSGLPLILPPDWRTHQQEKGTTAFR
jgi:hypothetical protein